jgi:hypothetical protein
MENKKALIKKQHDQLEWYSKLGLFNVCKTVQHYIKEYLEPSLETIQEKAKAIFNNKESQQQLNQILLGKKQEKIDLRNLIEILKLNKNDMDSHLRLSYRVTKLQNLR